jgi:hypothetical protein
MTLLDDRKGVDSQGDWKWFGACVQTPIKKQAFAFDDGGCLDDTGVALAVFRTRITPEGLVQIAA